MSRKLVRIVKPFLTDKSGELSLECDEIVQIQQDLDQFWFQGFCDGIYGRFPKSIALELEIPKEPNVYAVKKNFRNAKIGFLNISRGDLLILTENIDDVWGRGSLLASRDSTGIFPLSNVWPLNYDLFPVPDVRTYARVTVPMKAQLDNEIDLIRDETVVITARDDKMYYSGESMDGRRKGIFPKSFVEIIDNHIDGRCHSDDSPPSYDNVVGYSNSIGDNIQSYGRTLYPFAAEFPSELSFGANEIVNLIRHIDTEWIEGEIDGRIGIFPKNFIEIVVDCADCADSQEELFSYPPDTFARVLFPFDGPVSGDLRVEMGDTITLLRRLDPNWAEAMDDRNCVGLVPLNRVEVISDDRISFRSDTSCDQRSIVDSIIDLSDETVEEMTPPHRPPPPVPPHETMTTTVGDFVRHEPLRSSVTSDSSESARRAEAKRQKQQEQRSCVIMELLQTERDFLHDLTRLSDAFLLKPEESTALGIDLDTLLGNLPEVCDTSATLVRLLEESTLCKLHAQQMIGKCFIGIADQMRRAYGKYCRNHEEVQPLWQKYANSAETHAFLSAKLDRLRHETNCFDIPALLIKPVQRILKYPLLLNEMVKCTEEAHADYADLLTAVTLITSVATDINEFKRRQDLVLKYSRGGDASRRTRRLNLHSVMKKSSRFGLRLSTTFGLTANTKDADFDFAAQKFRTLEKTVKIFLRDLNAFVSAMNSFVGSAFATAEDVATYYGERSRQTEVDEFRTLHRTVKGQYWEEMRAAIDLHVIGVLQQLILKFSGPNHLIAKRCDKLLDFDLCAKRLSRDQSRPLQDQLNVARNTYEALNRQLIDELPQLCHVSLMVFHEAIQSFLRIRKTFIGRVAKHHLQVLELPLLLQFQSVSCSADISHIFHVKHNLIIDHLLAQHSLLSPHTFGRSTVERRPTISPKQQQSASQRAYLQSRYSPQQLFVATECHRSVDILDLDVSRDDLVAVLKQQDPTGHKHRWFVDSGAAKGFLPSKVLTQFHETRDDSTPIQHHYKLHAPPEVHRYDEVPASDDPPLYLTSEFDPYAPPHAPQTDVYFAAFAFKSNGQNQLSLEFGQMVVVHARSDQNGNEQWWFVEDHRSGRTGFVPSNYLMKKSQK